MAAKKVAPAGEGRRRSGPAPREVPYVVTTIRLEQKHWRWLREEALRRALESGGKTDASVVVRELVERAMKGR